VDGEAFRKEKEKKLSVLRFVSKAWFRAGSGSLAVLPVGGSNPKLGLGSERYQSVV